MGEEGVSFVDADAYSSNFKDNLTHKDIVMLQVKKIGENANKEWCGGYWENRQVTVGMNTQTISTYVPDTREVYSNAVEHLADLLYAHFDKTMKDAEEKLRKELEKAYKEKTVEPDKEHPQEEESKVFDRAFENTEQKLSYRSVRVQICRRLFRELCSFLHRKKYLELGSFED